MGEVEKRTTVQRFWWILRVWGVVWTVLAAILSEIWTYLRHHSRAWGYYLSFLATCWHLSGNMIARMIQLRVPDGKYRGVVGVIERLLRPTQ